jgi:sugar phosphate isomerase/epimerase
MAHAKDITGDPTKTDQAAGTGRLNWGLYCRLLKQVNYQGPMVLHNLRESQVGTCVAFLRRQLAM